MGQTIPPANTTLLDLIPLLQMVQEVHVNVSVRAWEGGPGMRPLVPQPAAAGHRGAVAVQIIARDAEATEPGEEPAGAVAPMPSGKPTL